MRKRNSSSLFFGSLKSRYVSGAIMLLTVCILFSWIAYGYVSEMLSDVTSDSKYQLQLSSDLNEFTESLYNIEKLIQYYPQLPHGVINKQLQDNLSKAEGALKKMEYGHWVVDHKQKNAIIELRSYISTYRIHTNWLSTSNTTEDFNAADRLSNIDTFVKNLRPIMDNIWGSVKQLENELRALSVVEINRLRKVQEGIAVILICGLLLALFFLVINFVAIQRWVVNPLLSLASDIADDDNHSFSAEAKTLEMKGLFAAIESRCANNKKREDQLEYQVLHDPLTGLPNRMMLLNDLQSAISSASKSGKCFTLLTINLDRFKDINDTLGHRIGDNVLSEISDRFRTELSSKDIIARLGGDEFAVLLHDADADKGRSVAQTLLNCFKKDLFLDGHIFNICGSIGMVVYPWHADSEHELLQRADVAMYSAKRKNFGYAIYDKSEDKHDVRNLSFEVELRDAIDNDDLMLHYQPKICMKTKQVVSAEVLLRWNHAEHGFISAQEISLLAEKTGLITQLSKWVVKTAIHQLSTWRDKGIELPLSINLSVWNLQDPNFFNFVEKKLQEFYLPADNITFEITESAVMSDPESALKTLQQLSSLGAKLSIDDYGTGFSSLQYLKILPVDEIKIDKSFVTDMVDCENDAVIVRSIIDLSHNLGLSVVAEGVETQDVYDVLEILRCDVVQGYHISRPVSSVHLEQWLDQCGYSDVASKIDNVTYLYQ